jgi:hypothetical protein
LNYLGEHHFLTPPAGSTAGFAGRPGISIPLGALKIDRLSRMLAIAYLESLSPACLRAPRDDNEGRSSFSHRESGHGVAQTKNDRN